MAKQYKQIYLGGCMGDWREIWQTALPNFLCYNPFEESCQDSISDFTYEDLEAIRESDLVVFRIDYHRYTGCCLEAGFSYALGKPIILVWHLKGRLDGMLLGVSKYVFNDDEVALDFIKERFSNGKAV